MVQLNMKLAAEYIESMVSQTYDRLNEKYNLGDILQKLQKILDGLYLPQPDKNGII